VTSRHAIWCRRTRLVDPGNRGTFQPVTWPVGALHCRVALQFDHVLGILKSVT